MKIVIAGLAVALALMGGAEAQAAEWSVSDGRTVYKAVSGIDCGAGSVDVSAPAGAHNVRPGLHVGDQFDASDEDGGSGMVQVVGAVVSGQAVRYTLQPVGDWCAKVYCDEEGCFAADQIRWTTEWREAFDVSYQVRKRVVLKGNASPLADTAMARHYSWWYDGLRDKPARCQVHGNRARCEASDGIGDSYVKAVVKIRLVPRAGQKPVWSYRLSARQINEYCVSVDPKPACGTRIKKRRSRVALPSWVRARTVG